MRSAARSPIPTGTPCAACVRSRADHLEIVPASVRAGDDLEDVAARVFEIDAATAEVVVDLALLLQSRIGPMVEPSLLEAAEDFVELALAHEERVVLGLYGVA